MAFLSIHSSPLGQAGSRDTGGMSTYLLGLSGALGRQGHLIDLYTRAANPFQAEILEIATNVRLIQIDDGFGSPAKNKLYNHFPAIADKIDKFCHRTGSAYEIIFSHYWLSGCVGRTLQQRWKTPHLLMFHTLGLAKNEACQGENEPQLRIDEEEALARESDRIIVAAKQEKERMLAYYDLPPEKVSVIPSGIDRDLFRPGDRVKAKLQLGFGKEKLILYVGRIEPVKGLDLLIKAVTLLPAEENYRLLIIGGDDLNSPLVQRLKEISAELGIARKINFKGLVEHDQLSLYYNAADITVLPSAYESFGLVVLESIACGTPVVAGPVGIIPELVAPADQGAHCLLVTDRSPASWAAAIRQAFLLPKPISPTAIETVLAPFSWPAIASRLAAECQSLLDRQR